MRPRQDLTDLFSTFAQFDADTFSGWIPDGRLRRSMQKQLAQSSPQSSEPFWSIYWHHRWQKDQPLPPPSSSPASRSADGSAEVTERAHGGSPSSPSAPSSPPSPSPTLPLQHLTAYLQEPCYWAAQRTARKFATVQFGVGDYFQLAIAEIHAVLKNFKADRGANLKTFANIAIPMLLKDILRQRQEANLCTSWGLLRRVSKKRLLEALQHVGLSASAIAQYQLAWVCFNTLYVQPHTGTNRLPAVDRQLWQAIADLYNRERKNQLADPGPECGPETLERWLNQCAAWIRAYLYPPVESLNMPKPGLESGSEIQDSLTDEEQDSLLGELIAEEEQEQRQTQRSQLQDVLVAAIAKLEPKSQELLKLYYQQGKTQQQIMQELQMSQATVSRRLTKTREALLTALVQWSQTTLNISPNPNLIKDMSAALEEWLGGYYGVPNSSSDAELPN